VRPFFAGLVDPEAARTGRVVGLRVLTWMLEPTASREAAWVAGVLALAGAVAYVRGRRQLPRAEAL
jgi:hypothetical protein